MTAQSRFARLGSADRSPRPAEAIFSRNRHRLAAAHGPTLLIAAAGRTVEIVRNDDAADSLIGALIPHSPDAGLFFGVLEAIRP